MENWIIKLSSDLFWDTDRTAVDPEKHARWLLERVLQRGRWEDWLVIRDHYGMDRIKDLSPNLKLDGKSRNYLSLYLSL